jgi:hypothetical protein
LLALSLLYPWETKFLAEFGIEPLLLLLVNHPFLAKANQIDITFGNLNLEEILRTEGSS